MSLHPPPARRGRRRAASRLAPVLALTTLLITGCDVRETAEDALAFGFPEPTGEESDSIYDLWLGSMAAATVVGILVLALIFYSVIRYRKRSDDVPRQVRYNLPIEVLYTTVPIVIVMVLFYFTVVSQNEVNELSDDGADVNIGVIGFQWNWQFNYVNEGVQVTGETNRPAQLVLPTERTVRFTETSPDVIHSFWVPEFLFKRDVIPGHTNTFEVRLHKEGEFIGRCAEFCGEKHAFMNFSVRVVSPEEYDSYIAGLQADPNAAILTTVSTADGSSS